MSISSHSHLSRSFTLAGGLYGLLSLATSTSAIAAPPTIITEEALVADHEGTADFYADVVDPDGDPVIVTIDYGDGHPPGAMSGPFGDTYHAAHKYPTGDYVAVVDACDVNNECASASVSVYVEATEYHAAGQPVPVTVSTPAGVPVLVPLRTTALAYQFIITTPPAYGVLIDGSSDTTESRSETMITYVPNRGFSGIDHFAFTVRDYEELRTVGEATVTIHVLPEATETCTTIRRGTGGEVADTFLTAQVPKLASGSYPYIYSGSANGHDKLALLRFGLSSIPAGAFVTSARLALYHSYRSAPSTEVAIHPILGPWSEAGATFATYGGHATEAFGSFATILGGKGSVSVDVRDLVQIWVDDGAMNHGIALVVPPGTPKVDFAASEHDTTSARPALEVCYQATAD